MSTVLRQLVHAERRIPTGNCFDAFCQLQFTLFRPMQEEEVVYTRVKCLLPTAVCQQQQTALLHFPNSLIPTAISNAQFLILSCLRQLPNVKCQLPVKQCQGNILLCAMPNSKCQLPPRILARPTVNCSIPNSCCLCQPPVPKCPNHLTMHPGHQCSEQKKETVDLILLQHRHLGL